MAAAAAGRGAGNDDASADPLVSKSNAFALFGAISLHRVLCLVSRVVDRSCIERTFVFSQAGVFWQENQKPKPRLAWPSFEYSASPRVGVGLSIETCRRRGGSWGGAGGGGGGGGRGGG